MAIFYWGDGRDGRNRVSTHPTLYVRHVDQNEKKIYVQEGYFKGNTGTNQLTNILLDRVGTSDLIIGDAAQKRLISDLWEAGLNIRRSLDKKPVRDIKRIQKAQCLQPLSSR